MTTSKELETALIDVRRAYRLLHAYHRRLCDLLEIVDERLAKTGFEFDRWQPHHAALPAKASKRFFASDRWAWDLAPSYQLQCEWIATSTKLTRRVVIIAVADTGFDDSCDGEPDPEHFGQVEGATSELGLGLWTADSQKPAWGAAWERFERLPNAHDGREHAVVADGTRYTRKYQTLGLSMLDSESAVKERLLGPVAEWASASAAR